MTEQGRSIDQGDKSVYVEQGNVFITYTDGRKILKPLTPPPFQSEVFLGREEDLQAIHDKLFNNDNLLLLINGNGGIGKTTLASKYYEKYQDRYQHLAWVLSEKSIANALLTALEQPLGLNFDPTLPMADRLTALLTAMAALNKPCLLVIDNANEVDDLNENYQDLRRCSNFHLLLTTRITEFAKAASYPINGLPEQEALALFKAYYPKHQASEDDLVNQIREAVGGNTLVLELLAKNLNQVNQFEASYAVADLLDDLRTKGLLQLSASEAVNTAYQAQGKLRSETPEAIIAAMYDLMALSEAEVAILSMFAVLPAENIAFSTIKDLLGATGNLKPTLKSLAQKGWLDHNPSENAFKCSPVIQEITRIKNANLQTDCRPLIDSLSDKLFYDGHHIIGCLYDKIPLYLRYAETLTPQLEITDIYTATLWERISNIHLVMGNLSKAFSYLEKYHQQSQQLYKSDPTNVTFMYIFAISNNKLAKTTHNKLGNLEQAFNFYEKCHCLVQELYNAYPDNPEHKKNLSISYCDIGDIYFEIKDLDRALDFYKDHHRLSFELFDAYPGNIKYANALAISFHKLGNTYLELGDIEKALVFYERYNLLEQELHNSFPTNGEYTFGFAISCQSLGRAYAELGNQEKSLIFFNEYNRLAQELYKDYPTHVDYINILAISYYKLAEIYEKMGHQNQAASYYQQAQNLWAELLSNFPSHVEFKKYLKIVEHKLTNF